MTNHWIDFKNTDCAIIIGSNAAENHPMSFKWMDKAREERGAKIISIDPRFTRTSSRADIYVPLRPGTDIALFGGFIKYVLDNNLYHRDYLVKYTNAAFLINEGFDFNDGLFTGYDEANRRYDQSTWSYQTDATGAAKKDETLQHPRSVFQLLKKHYARYDADTVSKVTGMPLEKFQEVARTFGDTGAEDKAGTILYAMGTTQHTVGTQNVRGYAVLQLLLGNVGRAGGGINALRGEANVQGSTDMALLFDTLPGYLASPMAVPEHADLAAYNAKETPASGYWVNKPKFMVSLLKAFWGSAASIDNDFAYHYLPKRRADKNYSHIGLFEVLHDKVIKGMLIFGQNPAVGGPNSNKEHHAMENLDWLMVADLFETETAAFWKAPGVTPANIKTEIFLLPAANSYEKDGSITNSGRWVQWRYKAVSPKGEAKSDLWISDRLAKRLKSLYQDSVLAKDQPIKNLYWNFGSGEPDAGKVAREVNGYYVDTGRQVDLFSKLAQDGSTACGNWIMSGMYPPSGNLTQSRNNKDNGLGSYLGWAYAWPANRRILYNRSSAKPDGTPWPGQREVIWWNNIAGKWEGNDVPDFNAALNPSDAGGTNPFIMRPEGVAGLFANLNEGPFPEHYEPYESPVKNLLSPIELNPVVKIWDANMNSKGGVDRYPVVATTYRLTEHYQSGAMTRNQPWLVELVPSLVVEMSPTLANARGIKNGDKVKVVSARGEVEGYAMVTERLKPLLINGRSVEQIGLPWHFGHQGLATGSSANRLTAHIGDGNTMMPEYKVLLCDVRRV